MQAMVCHTNRLGKGAYFVSRCIPPSRGLPPCTQDQHIRCWTATCLRRSEASASRRQVRGLAPEPAPVIEPAIDEGCAPFEPHHRLRLLHSLHPASINDPAQRTQVLQGPGNPFGCMRRRVSPRQDDQLLAGPAPVFRTGNRPGRAAPGPRQGVCPLDRSPCRAGFRRLPRRLMHEALVARRQTLKHTPPERTQVLQGPGGVYGEKTNENQTQSHHPVSMQ